MKHYLIAYDVVESKRRVKVAKLVYGYALGGQKSALEVPVSFSEVKAIALELEEKIDADTDKVNIIGVGEEAILLGMATQLEYDEGMIIL
ncbi:MAG: CRISPR-associated endonuclease Cas2 [Sulfurovum sp.]|nr:CRISPR-associated endonuclease Cas2 [Sulfurovum sp.]